MTTQFQLRPYDKAAFESLSAAGMLRPIAQALAARGVRTPDDLREDWPSLLPPASLEGTAEAARLLADLRDARGRAVIVADYDCDGATACAIAMRGLSALGIAVSYVVPDRFKLGYGLSPEIVDLCCERDSRPDLIVTVDNGIASVEGVAHAKALGIKVLITDHHLPAETLPEADCIVNPNLKESQFPSKALAGCGVMYYVLLALRAELRRRGVFTAQTQPRLDTLSDLVALGTVADVVKLDKNNRILVSQGLARIRRGQAHPGVAALFAAAGRDWAKANARDFAFSVAPLINAAGRLTGMGVGIRCLLADNASDAQAAAMQLEELNRERRDLEETMQSDAADYVAQLDWRSKATVTLYDGSWHQGVVGLVASRVKERIHRPVIAFANDGDEDLKGSGRSIEGVHLRDALDAVSKMAPDVIERFGGHALAAGLTIKKENLRRFASLFEFCVSRTADPAVFDRIVKVDGALAPEEISFPLVEAIAGRIWGQGFEAPVFANDFTVLSQRVLKDAHLKLFLDLGGTRFDAIFFRHNTPLPERVRLAYRPEINEFQGRRSVQLVIEAAEV